MPTVGDQSEANASQHNQKYSQKPGAMPIKHDARGEGENEAEEDHLPKDKTFHDRDFLWLL